MTEISMMTLYILKGFIAGVAALGIAMIAIPQLTRNILFANISVGIGTAFVITAIRESFWLFGDQTIIFIGMTITAIAILAVVNFLRNPAEENQISVSLSIFVSGVIGIIIGLDMIILSFIAFITVVLFMYIGRQFIKN